MLIEAPISILKSLWSRLPDGRWGITDLKGLELKAGLGFEPDYFIADGDIELLTNRPSQNVHEAFASFGPTDFLLKQSILPIVAWREGGDLMRSIGTASVISCTGYVMTAAHILMDPFDNDYGAIRQGNRMELDEALNFGVIIPTSPAYGTRGLRIFPFEKFWLWGQWKENPLIHENDRFEYSTDIAICKIPEMPHGAAHQPLNLSLNPFATGEAAYSLGYAEIADIPIDYSTGDLTIRDFKMDLHVSIGKVGIVFPENHLKKEVPTPGPCFDFDAKILGKMSGAPTFGAEGAVIRGVVSRSFSGEYHAFGSMLGPVMDLPLDEPGVRSRTLRTLLNAGNEGMAQVKGVGL